MAVWQAFKRGLKGASKAFGPAKFSIEGHAIVCTQCRHDLFENGKAQLNTAGLSFLNLDWANKSATTLACVQCGHIMWFAKKLEKHYEI